jgi:hypothetical protein
MYRERDKISGWNAQLCYSYFINTLAVPDCQFTIRPSVVNFAAGGCGLSLKSRTQWSAQMKSDAHGSTQEHPKVERKRIWRGTSAVAKDPNPVRPSLR